MLKGYFQIRKVLFCLILFLCSMVYAVDWQSYTIVVNQRKLHYYQSGKGSPIILLTGYATTSNFWDKKFVNCLAQNNTVYLVDYWGINTNDNTGSGNTSIAAMAEDTFALTKALHLDKPNLVGWSMGGAVAQQISFVYPKEIGKVILIAPLSTDNQPVESSGESPNVNLKTYADVLNYVFANNLYDYKPSQLKHYKNELFAAKEKLFPNNQVGENQHSAMNEWTSNPQTLDYMKDSEIDYLFLIANQDKMLDPAKTVLDAKKYQHAQIIKFENSGHNISMQAPEMVCSQIENFIK